MTSTIVYKYLQFSRLSYWYALQDFHENGLDLKNVTYKHNYVNYKLSPSYLYSDECLSAFLHDVTKHKKKDISRHCSAMIKNTFKYIDTFKFVFQNQYGRIFEDQIIKSMIDNYYRCPTFFKKLIQQPPIISYDIVRNITFEIMEKFVLTGLIRFDTNNFDIYFNLIRDGALLSLHKLKIFIRFSPPRRHVDELFVDTLLKPYQYPTTIYDEGFILGHDKDLIVAFYDFCENYQMSFFQIIKLDEYILKTISEHTKRISTDDILEIKNINDLISCLIELKLKRGFNYSQFYDTCINKLTCDNLKLITNYFNINHKINFKLLNLWYAPKDNLKYIFEHFKIDIHKNDEIIYRYISFKTMYEIEKPKLKSTYQKNMNQIIHENMWYLIDKIIISKEVCLEYLLDDDLEFETKCKLRDYFKYNYDY